MTFDIANNHCIDYDRKEVSVVIWWTAGLILGYALGQCSLMFSISLNKKNNANVVNMINNHDHDSDKKKGLNLKIIDSSNTKNNNHNNTSNGSKSNAGEKDGKAATIKKLKTDNNYGSDDNDSNEGNNDTSINISMSNDNKNSCDDSNIKGLLINKSEEKHVYVKRRFRSDSVATQTSEISTSSTKLVESNAEEDTSPTPRYIEMLIHNVSHTDLILGINYCSNKVQDEDLLCRPRFSAFDSYCRRVHKALSRKPIPSSMIRSYPRVRRSNITPHFTLSTPAKKSPSFPSNVNMNPSQNIIQSSSSFLNSNDSSHHAISTDRNNNNKKGKEMLPVGFQLASSSDNKSVEVLNDNDFLNLRIRGRDMSKLHPRHVQKLWMTNTLVSPRSSRVVTYDQKVSIQSDGEKDIINPSSPGHPIPDSNSDINDTAEQEILEDIRINGVYFPLLSCLMRRWNSKIARKFPQRNQSNQANGKYKVKQVIILVTGVGTPRNYTHDLHGNSTETCAQLMETYIRILYPDVDVVRIHSQTNIFKYDENITFANEELMPCIDAYRDAHAKGQPYPVQEPTSDYKRIHERDIQKQHRSYNPDWKQSFNVTLSFADGSPARTHAIQAALRSYRPTYFHFWQLKTFWHESKICDDDIEEHSFEDMETAPAMEASNLRNKEVQMLVEEMDKFKRHFLESVTKKDTDIAKFWLRKTKKPVLAVLLVNQPGKGLIMYRGTNMEVSMPTGSLCAERNVIGTALASDPSLKREDLLMVAVLAVPLKTFELESNGNGGSMPPLSPPGGGLLCLPVKSNSGDTNGVDNENRLIEQGSSIIHNKTTGDFSEEKASSQSNIFCQKVTPEERCMKRSMSLGSFASIVEDDDNYENDGSNNNLAHTTADQTIKRPLRRIKLYNNNKVFPSHMTSHQSNEGVTSALTQHKKKTVIVHSHEDINPLRPCGACNEWLKKIAECNPHFKVVTFTDMDCNGIYVSSCQD